MNKQKLNEMSNLVNDTFESIEHPNAACYFLGQLMQILCDEIQKLENNENQRHAS